MSDLAVMFLLHTLRACARAVSLRTCQRIGGTLGWCAGLFAWPLNRTIARNWRIAFGKDPTFSERQRIWSTLAGNVVAGLKFGVMSVAEKGAVVKVTGLENLAAAAAPGKGVVLVVGHLSAWELLAQIPMFLVDRLFHTLYQTLKNSRLDAFIRSERNRCGVGLINRSGAWKEMSRCLRKGEIVVLFSDQSAGDAGIWTPLFGKLASCSPLTSTVAARTGAAITTLTVRTLPDGTYEVAFIPAFAPARGRETGEVEADINRWLETVIRASPFDWLWHHDRWKTPDPRFLLQRDTRAVYVPPGTDLQPFRILVRGMNWLGDAVMHLAALRDIKAGRPDARLAVLTSPKLAGLYRLCPFVDEVIEAPASRSLFGTARLIRAWNPDVMVLLPNSWRVVLEAWLGGVSERLGYRVNRRGRRALPRKIPVESRASGTEHQRLTWQRAVPYIGGESRPEPVRLHPVLDPKRSVYGVIAPGAEFGPAKRWPADRYAAAAEKVGDTIPHWIIVGAPGDRAACDAVARELPGAENRCGKTTLDELAVVLAGATVVLCNDSGVMHLAAACGAPTVAVFGSTEPKLTRPVNDGVVILRKHVPCSPCFKRTCPLKHTNCLMRITPDDMARGISAALTHGGTEPLEGIAAG